MKFKQRRWSLIATAALTAVAAISGACANPSAPPGGPPDILPPIVTNVSPFHRDTSVLPKTFVLSFDEVINEVPNGAQDLSGLVFISPRSEGVRVNWKRNKLEISPRGGFRDSTVYSITVRPGIRDLRNNSIDTALNFVFSTRGPIPGTAVSGVVFDWPRGAGAKDALVEAISVVDTTVAYVSVADSAGRFLLRHLPAGQYTIRGFLDRNSNRLLERTELWDTVTVPLIDSAAVELYSFIHDTTPARITEVAVQDSGKRLRLTFDKPLAINQLFSPLQFSVRSLPDSIPLASRVVIVRTAEQQLAIDSTARKQRADSIAAAAAAKDTVAPDSAAIARADSIARERRLDSLARVEQIERETRRMLALRGGRPAPPLDTMPLPKPSRPKPTSELLIVFESPIPADARIIVEANDITTISGTKGKALRPLLTPKRDTVAADSIPSDTTPTPPPQFSLRRK